MLEPLVGGPARGLRRAPMRCHPASSAHDSCPITDGLVVALNDIRIVRRFGANRSHGDVVTRTPTMRAQIDARATLSSRRGLIERLAGVGEDELLRRRGDLDCGRITLTMA